MDPPGSVVRPNGVRPADNALVDGGGRRISPRLRYHLNVRALIEHRAELRTSRIVVTHVGEETLARLAEVPFDVAADGSVFQL